MTLLDHSFPVLSRSVFDQTIGIHWYDGLTSGVAKSHLGVAFKFDILAWGPSQHQRIHAFAPLQAGVFKRVVDLLKNQKEPTWPIWVPEWDQNPRGSEFRSLLSKVGPPEYAVATDSMFTTLLAAKLFDGAARKLLPTSYDGVPSDDNFEFWKEFLNLSDK